MNINLHRALSNLPFHNNNRTDPAPTQNVPATNFNTPATQSISNASPVDTMVDWNADGANKRLASHVSPPPAAPAPPAPQEPVESLRIVIAVGQWLLRLGRDLAAVEGASRGGQALGRAGGEGLSSAANLGNQMARMKSAMIGR